MATVYSASSTVNTKRWSLVHNNVAYCFTKILYPPILSFFLLWHQFTRLVPQQILKADLRNNIVEMILLKFYLPNLFFPNQYYRSQTCRCLRSLNATCCYWFDCKIKKKIHKRFVFKVHVEEKRRPQFLFCYFISDAA